AACARRAGGVRVPNPPTSKRQPLRSSRRSQHSTARPYAQTRGRPLENLAGDVYLIRQGFARAGPRLAAGAPPAALAGVYGEGRGSAEFRSENRLSPTSAFP